MALGRKYLTESNLFSAAADVWAADRGLLIEQSVIRTLFRDNNLSELTDVNQARINLGLRLGHDVQAHSTNLDLIAAGPAPSDLGLNLLSKTTLAEWTSIFNNTTVVTSVDVSGGSTGMSFTGGPITESGTLTLDGTLGVAHGGTGVSSLSALKSALNLNNVTNISLPAAGPSQLIGWNGSGTALVNIDVPGTSIAKGTVVGLWSDFSTKTIDGSINLVETTGYSTDGLGGARYISDSLANSTLAAAHPRACRVTANGRYFRLVGEYITVEQTGALGTGNDQPAIQAAVSYALATGIATVRFTKSAYDLWTPTRTTTWGPGWPGAGDGHPIYITGSISLVGVSGNTKLTFLNRTGGVKTSGLQVTDWGTWYGGGVYVDPNSSGAAADIERVTFENLTLDGTVPCTNPYTNAGANLSDKGIMFASNGNYGVKLCTLRNVIIHNFCGELFYGGSFKANSTLTAENCEMYNSNQSAWNPTGLGRVFATNCNFHDSYLPSEIITGQGHVYVGCRFANGANCGAVSTQFFNTGYSYAYPNRDTTKPITWCVYDDTIFENVSAVNLSSWTRGKITLVDSSLVNLGTDDSDIDLDVVHIIDKSNGPGITIGGPPTLTTPWRDCPPGTYIKPPANINLRTVWKRTALGEANNRYSAGIVINGLVDKNSVRVTIDGELRGAMATASQPTGFAWPLIEVKDTVRPVAGATYMCGLSETISTDKTYRVNWPAASLSPTGVGPFNITLDNTYGYATGQRVTFFYGYPTGTEAISFAASGAGMMLPENRKLLGYGDRLVLIWDGVLQTWVEEKFISKVKRVFTGSATYNAPLIATGAQTTTTVTVTGARLGDYVDRISLGVDAGGLVVSGYVSSNDTVTVVLRNDTGAGVDLVSTTLSVEVKKKI